MEETNTKNPDYFHKVVDCQWACPAHTPVPEYIRLIGQGKYSDAYMVNWTSNVFPGILGRTCDRPCEPACRRGRVEEGGIVIDRISAKYSEDDLTGKTPDLIDPAITRTGKRNGEYFWEVQENRPGCPRSIPRRYVHAAAPTLMRGGSHWRIPLNKQMVDRSRNQTFDRRQA